MKSFLFALLHSTGVLRAIAWFNRNRVTILCYHSVSKRTEPHPSDVDSLHLREQQFRLHLDYLQSHHTIISLGEFLRARTENRPFPPGAVVLTFEDGFRNFYSVVAPILLARRIPATCFIITSPEFTKDVSRSDRNWDLTDDESFLAWDEIRELSSHGIEFGSHTSTHVPLSGISLGEARVELNDSLNALVGKVGRSAVALSYPHGDTSESVNLLAEAVGYSCGLTTALGPNDADCDLFALRRTVIPAADDVASFAARVSGLTWRWDQLRNIVKSLVSNRAPVRRQPYDPSVAGSAE